MYYARPFLFRSLFRVLPACLWLFRVSESGFRDSFREYGEFVGYVVTRIVVHDGGVVATPNCGGGDGLE